MPGWLTYETALYTFSYPPEATVRRNGVAGFPAEELPVGMTEEAYLDQLKETYPGAMCVRVNVGSGFVTFQPSAEAGGKYIEPCGVTGVGDFKMEDISETLTIDNQAYSASGFLARNFDTDAWASQFYILWLDDDTRIDFGSMKGDQAQFQEIEETLRQIVTSFRLTETAPSASLSFDIGQDTLILYTVIQDGNWALKAYPDSGAFTEPAFDTLYGPEIRMDDVRRYTEFSFGPQLSPNGRYLLLPGVGGYEGSPFAVDNTGLWFVNLQTDEVRQLLPRAKAFTWSPYGDHITYVDGDTLYTLSVAEGAEPQPLFSHPDLWALYARWSPDGSHIATMTTAFGERDETGYPEIIDTYWLVDTTSGEATEIATRPGFAIEHVAEEISWSPTGRYLLVRNELFDVNGQTLLSDLPGRVSWLPAAVAGSVEPDQLLVNGNEGMVIMGIDGQEVTRLYDAYVDGWAFSHNGRYLAYLPPDTENEIVVLDLGSQESISLDATPLGRPTLQWSATDDYLLLDDGNRISPIWALAVQPGSQVQEILENGTLLETMRRPLKNPPSETAVPMGLFTFVVTFYFTLFFTNGFWD